MASGTDGEAPPRRDDRTMQLDAVAGELDLSASVADDEEQGAERDAQSDVQHSAAQPEDMPLPILSAPPPLPSKRRSRRVYVVFALVVLSMAALGVGAGLLLLHTAPVPRANPPPVRRAPPPRNVVQIGEFVIQPATRPATPPAPTPTKTP